MAGSKRLLAASTSTFYGQAMTAGDIYTVMRRPGKLRAHRKWCPGNRRQAQRPSGHRGGPHGQPGDRAGGQRRNPGGGGATGTFYGKKMAAGAIYTIAGDGSRGFSGDGGPAVKAELWFPYGVAVDVAGNALIADQSNNRIRVVAAITGAFYGQAMTAGHIYTISSAAERVGWAMAIRSPQPGSPIQAT